MLITHSKFGVAFARVPKEVMIGIAVGLFISMYAWVDYVARPENHYTFIFNEFDLHCLGKYESDMFVIDEAGREFRENLGFECDNLLASDPDRLEMEVRKRDGYISMVRGYSDDQLVFEQSSSVTILSLVWIAFFIYSPIFLVWRSCKKANQASSVT